MTRLLVELCAGTAALSWSLFGARFPVSRMGSKVGYCDAIRGALGLHDPPAAVLLVEPDVELARTLALLSSPGGPAAVAEVIRGWIPCPACPAGAPVDGCEECNGTGTRDARRLWDRLRKERPESSPEREGGWLIRQNWTLSGDADTGGFKASKAPEVWTQTARFLPVDKCREIGAYIRERREASGMSRRDVNDALGLSTACSWWEGRPKGTRPPSPEVWERLKPLIGLDDRYDVEINSKEARVRPRPAGWKPWTHSHADQEGVAGRLDALVSLPATVLCCGAEEIEPRDVARWLVAQGWTNGGRGGMFGGEVIVSKTGTHWPLTRERMGERLDDLPEVAATVYAGPAEDVRPGTFAPGECVVYIDPPYQGTTGYAHSFDRPAVLAVAQRWADAGAVVCISEAEPLPLPGWHHHEITDTRRGQRRTFSKQQREWLTMSAEPVPRHQWPARDALPGQGSLFAVAGR